MGNNLPFGLNQCGECRMCYPNEEDLQKIAKEHHRIKEGYDSDIAQIDVQMDSKTMELLSNMSPIGVATISPNINTIQSYPPTTPTNHILSALPEISPSKESDMEIPVYSGFHQDANNQSSPKAQPEAMSEMSTVRVKHMSEILDPIELQEAIKTNYDPGTPFSHSADSSMDEDELEEIEKRKSETLTKQNKSRNSEKQLLGRPQLYKTDSDKAMQQDDMDMLRTEMEQELVALKSERGVDYKIYEGDNKVQSASLFRPRSAYKWDNDDLAEQQDQMTKQLAHLLMDNTGNTPE